MQKRIFRTKRERHQHVYTVLHAVMCCSMRVCLVRLQETMKYLRLNMCLGINTLRRSFLKKRRARAFFPPGRDFQLRLHPVSTTPEEKQKTSLSDLRHFEPYESPLPRDVKLLRLQNITTQVCKVFDALLRWIYCSILGDDENNRFVFLCCFLGAVSEWKSLSPSMERTHSFCSSPTLRKFCCVLLV